MEKRTYGFGILEAACLRSDETREGWKAWLRRRVRGLC